MAFIRLRTILIVLGLMPGQFPIDKLAVAQDRTRSYVQITMVSKTSGILHLDPKNPATCGTADVNVFTFKSGSPDPEVRVSMFGLSNDPSDVMVSVSPETESTTIASTFTVFKFKVCAAGNVAGKFSLQAIVSGVGPADYEIKQPDPPDTGRVTFEIVP